VPALSVVMPVLNGERYVDEAVASILAQTFRDFEFVILDDGSTDRTRDRLRAWAAADPRIRLIEADRSLGPAGSSNAVVAAARCPLVARMDADDRARPERLAEQLRQFRHDPDLVLLGTLAVTIDGSGRRVRAVDEARLVRISPFAPFGHSSIMFRKDGFDRTGGYRSAADKWEDVDLYLRLAELGSVAVLRAPLVEVRQWESSSRVSHGAVALEEGMDLMHRCLAEYRAGRSFDALLEDRCRPRKLQPQSFVAANSRLVWSGRSPQLTGRFLRSAALGPDLVSLATLLWVAWADVSPRSLRLGLKGLLAIRNRIARRRIGARTMVPWRPQHARDAGADRTFKPVEGGGREG
jgi:glycosyltransferase involved in cell wall biosynthesis